MKTLQSQGDSQKRYLQFLSPQLDGLKIRRVLAVSGQPTRVLLDGLWKNAGPILLNRYHFFDFASEVLGRDIRSTKEASEWGDFYGRKGFVRFSVSERNSFLEIDFSVDKVNLSDLGMPELVRQGAFRNSGWMLLAAKNDRIIEALQTRFLEEAPPETCILQVKSSSSNLEPAGKSTVYTCNWQEFAEGKWPTASVGAFSLWLDSLNLDENVLGILDRGLPVQIYLRSWSALQALTTLRSKSLSNQSSRWSRHLNWLVTVEEVFGLQQEALFPTECLHINPEMRQLIDNSDWKHLEISLFKNKEGLATRSMNQSLVSHILRRQIDLRSGMRVSPRPEELDQMLKDIGI
jgi:hypothetical protein